MAVGLDQNKMRNRRMRRTVRNLLFATVAVARGVIYAGAFAGSITGNLFG